MLIPFHRPLLSVVSLAALVAAAGPSFAQSAFTPGNLLLSHTVYDNNAANIAVGTNLPPGCAPIGTNCKAAVATGTYPGIFNNESVDASFGITSPILIDQLTPSGQLVSTLTVPNSGLAGITGTSNQLVTSFPSKSEIALNQSTDGQYVTFMGYFAPVDAIDVSNSNTAGAVDSTNLVTQSYYRVVATLAPNGSISYTATNAYSGNNGRAAIQANVGGSNYLYTAGNAGNGANPQPVPVIAGAGVQIMSPSTQPLSAQVPAAPSPVGSFNITQLGDTADKAGKDTNFRGLTIYNNVLYTTKGSGGNGINTVYFVDTTGNACPTGGVGLPQTGATLPTSGINYSSLTTAQIQSAGITPYNMCILKGFPTSLASSKTVTPSYPFGVWFASPTVLYVADEGNGTNTYSAATGTYTAAASQTTAGLQKWTFNPTTGSWTLAYTLQAGLNLGVPYTVAGYPTGNNSATNLPWAPATDGLRNITGRVNGDGTVTIYAITSTVSGATDQGADPNQLVTITDNLAATTLPGGESFTSLRTANNLEVLRGISFTPGTPSNTQVWSIAGAGHFDAAAGTKPTDILFSDRVGDVAAWQTAFQSGNVSVSAGLSLGSAPPQWMIAGVGDFDGNGKSDVLLRNTATGDIAIWFSNSTGNAIASGQWVSVLSQAWQIAGIADFNKDSKSDILLRNLQTGDVAVWLMSGASVLPTSQWIGAAATNFSIAGVGDFNGDGYPDILWRDINTGAVVLWTMNGSLTPTGATVSSSVPLDWQIAGVGDFDANGMADILWLNQSGSVAVWLMNGATVSNAAGIATLPSDWKIAGVGDFNADGKSDVLLRQTSTGLVAAWLMNGASAASSVGLALAQ